MATAFGEILTPALGVALSPFPIVAVILLLGSDRGRAAASAFAGGWACGLAGLVGIVVLVMEQFGIEPDDSGPSTAASIIRIVLGSGLVALAVKQWKARPGPDETPPTPGWMASLSAATPIRSFGYGAMLSGLNPKNLLFNLVAGAAIAASGASVTGEVAAWVLYILLASGTVLAPLLWFLVAQKTAAAQLDEPRRWLIRNSSVMVATMLLVIGISQIGDGISGLG